MTHQAEPIEYRVLRCGCAPSCFVVLRSHQGLMESLASFGTESAAVLYRDELEKRQASLGHGRAIPKKRVRS